MLLSQIQAQIDKITMYKILIYTLSFLYIVVIIGSIFEQIDYSLFSIFISLFVLLISSLVINSLIGKILKIPVHQESAVITALILFFIYQPVYKIGDVFLLGIVSLIAIISKYIFAYNRTHIFNPVAISAFTMGTFFSFPALWWVGGKFFLPFVVLISYIILMKQRKFIFFASFLIASFISIYLNYSKFFPTPFILFDQVINYWPLIFFGSVMLTEPITMPSRKKYEYMYAIFVGFMIGFIIKIGNLGMTPELALISGNLLFFIINPRYRVKLQFKESKALAEHIFEFSFESDKNIKFISGQYAEIMLPHKNTDARGIRRYFTIASGVNDSAIKFGIKIIPDGSSFKNALTKMRKGDSVFIHQIQGDFIPSPKDKLLFIAGGIGITPFISFIRTQLEKNSDTNSIDLFYLSSIEQGYAYKDLLNKAKIEKNIITHFLTKDSLTNDYIIEKIPDYKNRKIFISGPNGMVNYYRKYFKRIGIPSKNIKVDFFNGL